MSDVYIGLEYEPQLTLLDYGSKAVNVYINTVDEFKIDTYDTYIDLSIPWYVFREFNEAGVGTSHDMFANLEVRTQPCLIQDVREAIHEQTSALKHFVELLAVHYGSVAVLLPPSTKYVLPETISLESYVSDKAIYRSKHISLSHTSEWLECSCSIPIPTSLSELTGSIPIPMSLFEIDTITNTTSLDTCSLRGARWHVKVPYAYTRYTELVQQFASETKVLWFQGLSQKPQLIAYAYAKQKAHLVNPLV